MVLNFHRIGGNNICSEYVVKAGDDFKKLAKDYLGDAKLATSITHKRTPKLENILIQGAISAGEIILIPPVPDSIKNKI